MRHILVIAKNTFRESVRDRVLFGAALLSIAAMLASLFVGSISLDQDFRIIIDLSLSAIYLLQIFIAIFIGSSLIFKEVERKTFFLIIPKPVEREAIIIGKALGLMCTTVVMTAITGGALSLLLVMKGGAPYIPSLIASILMSYPEVLILVLFSFLFSLFSSPIFSALFTFAFFIVGHSESILRTVIEKTSLPLLKVLLTVLYYALPNLEKFNVRNDVVYKHMPDAQNVVLALSYALVYVTLLFLANRFLFSKKEF